MFDGGDFFKRNYKVKTNILFLMVNNILDHDNKEEQRNFLESEMTRANKEYKAQIRKVHASTIRFERKRQMMDPKDKTPPTDIDDKIRSVKLQDLEVSSPERYIT